jgi:hypothetical protein
MLKTYAAATLLLLAAERKLFELCFSCGYAARCAEAQLFRNGAPGADN